MAEAPVWGQCRFFIQLVTALLLHQVSMAVFRAVGAIARQAVAANALGFLLITAAILFNGFIIARGAHCFCCRPLAERRMRVCCTVMPHPQGGCCLQCTAPAAQCPGCIVPHDASTCAPSPYDQHCSAACAGDLPSWWIWALWGALMSTSSCQKTLVALQVPSAPASACQQHSRLS